MGHGYTSPRRRLIPLLFLLLLRSTSVLTGQTEPYRRDSFSPLFEGQNAVFVCDPSGQVSGTLSYQWTLNDTHIIATRRSFTIYNVRESDSGLYKCIVRGKIMDKEVVAEHATFAYVKKAETMLTQVVDEGVSVIILCNVTDSNVPPGSKNLRYQWHNPNGTLISNRGFLRLANIRIHESGVYVCTASVDVNGTRHEASRGTNIQVKRAGNVIFPGLSGHTIHVLETSPVHQTCRVEKHHPGANYTYHWLGPHRQKIADGSQLTIDYALRSRHSGAYTCVAKSIQAAHRDLEGTVYVIVLQRSDFDVRRFDECESSSDEKCSWELRLLVIDSTESHRVVNLFRARSNIMMTWDALLPPPRLYFGKHFLTMRSTATLPPSTSKFAVRVTPAASEPTSNHTLCIQPTLHDMRVRNNRKHAWLVNAATAHSGRAHLSSSSSSMRKWRHDYTVLRRVCVRLMVFSSVMESATQGGEIDTSSRCVVQAFMHKFGLKSTFSDFPPTLRHETLRFQISTLSENLRIGGFTHRRVSIPYLPFPVGVTQEQFEYTWISPEGQPVTPQPSPEMYVQLQSPQQFGLYTIRVRGIHSGYSHELQSDVLLQMNPDDYSLRISGQGSQMFPNSRVEVLCEVQPLHPGAKVRWVNAQNLMVASDGRLMIERFKNGNEGSYFCEAFLPDGNILLKQLFLQLENGTEIGADGIEGDSGSSYTIHIASYPSHFTYDDAVELHCIVQPDANGVTFEWTKDGQVIGNNQVLDIPAFGRQDTGKYQCRATIQSVVKYAEEILTLPSEDTWELAMGPRVVSAGAFKPFQIECTSHRSGVRPSVVFSSDANITIDSQFQLLFPAAQRVIISVPRGLSTVYNGMSIRCLLNNVYSKQSRIFIQDSCPTKQISCLSGECVLIDKICNGVNDCRDGSDESEQFCCLGLLVWPGGQDARRWHNGGVPK
ncbi:Contactin-1 [Echinococcus granulosus]|uniref:Contactin-1 n=1 Tax=Echinococcus granulosus TaxID=6210 RepID=W6UML7_ECHGR|nr:Contactin-1 [Echinococcus granulosus]EUB62790.1 Contactin-1 [Echinococcus granulosus]